MTDAIIKYRKGQRFNDVDVTCAGVSIPGVTGIQVNQDTEGSRMTLSLELWPMIVEVEQQREDVSATPSESLLDTLNKIPVSLIRDILAGIEDYCRAREDTEGVKR